MNHYFLLLIVILEYSNSGIDGIDTFINNVDKNSNIVN